MSAIVVLLFSLLAGCSVASGMGGNINQTNLPQGACILARWKKYTSLFDVNKDGKISVADSEMASGNFTKLNGREGDKKSSMREKFNTSIALCLMWNGQEISENEYGVLQRDAYLEDQSKFVEKVKECLNQRLDILDANDDYILSEKELKTNLITLNFNDERKDNALFQSFNPKLEGIPLNDLFDYLLKFFTDDDCSDDDNRMDLLKSQQTED